MKIKTLNKSKKKYKYSINKIVSKKCSRYVKNKRNIVPNTNNPKITNIPPFSKPKFQLSSIKEIYKQNITMEYLYKLLISNNNWNYIEYFIKSMGKSNKTIKKYGMCLTTKRITNNKIALQVVYGNLETLDTLDKSLFLRKKINCNLKDYNDINSKDIYKNCRKPPKSSSDEDFYTFYTGNTIVLPNIKKFNINDISHAFSFMRNVKTKQRKQFWNLVGSSIKLEMDNAKNKHNVRICIHIGPCHHQGTPIFHVKVGTNVAKCLVGNHIKSLTKQLCNKNGKVWSKNHDEDWLMDIITPQKM